MQPLASQAVSSMEVAGWSVVWLVNLIVSQLIS
jgi:hypothetical protein